MNVFKEEVRCETCENCLIEIKPKDKKTTTQQ